MDLEFVEVAETWALSIPSQDTRRALWNQWFLQKDTAPRTPAIVKAVVADGCGYLLETVTE